MEGELSPAREKIEFDNREGSEKENEDENKSEEQHQEEGDESEEESEEEDEEVGDGSEDEKSEKESEEEHEEVGDGSEEESEKSCDESEEEEEEEEDDEESQEDDEEENDSGQSERRTKRLHDNDAAPSCSNLADVSDSEEPECIKSIGLINYSFKTHYSEHGDCWNKFVIRSTLGGTTFVKFRKLLINVGILEMFKKSCFGHFVDIPMKQVNFPSSIVHGLLVRRIICEKKYELWFEHENMPISFGLKEFALMTGLRCHSLPSSQILDNHMKKGNALWKFVKKKGKGKRINGTFLFEMIKSRATSKEYKLALAQVWFLHCILCACDLSKAVDIDMIKLAGNPHVFNEYPWGLKSYTLTIKYLSMPLKFHHNLYGFPWAFMAWAFEAIPELQKQAKRVLPEKTLPRMIRWMSYDGLRSSRCPFNTIDKRNTYNKVVHPFLFPTNVEKRKSYMKNFENFDDEVADETIDRLKIDLAGVTTITSDVGYRKVDGEDRVPTERRYEEKSPSKSEDPARSTARGIEKSTLRGVDRGSFEDQMADSPMDFNFGGQHTDGGICRLSFDNVYSNTKCSCECEKCAKKQEAQEKEISDMKNELKDLKNEVKGNGEKIDNLENTIKKLIEELSILNKKLEPRRMLKDSKYRKSPYTFGARKTRKRTEISTQLHVDLYKPLGPDQREILQNFLDLKDKEKRMYEGVEYDCEDFENLIDMHQWMVDKHVDGVLTLMRLRYINYPRHYAKTDMILDCNFCHNLIRRYEECCDLAAPKVRGGPSILDMLSFYQFDDDFMGYATGAFPYPGGRKWDGMKRIFTILNLDQKHYVTLIYLIDEQRIAVYDCNISVFKDDVFADFILPITVMFPKFIQQSKKFPDVPAREFWEYERVSGLPKNATGTACGGYSLMFIEHLITNNISWDDLNDNSMRVQREKFAMAIFKKQMEP